MGTSAEGLVNDLSAEARRLGWRPTVTEVTPVEVRLVFMPALDDEAFPQPPDGDVW